MSVNSLSDMSAFICLTAGQSACFISALITSRKNHTNTAQCYF